LPPLFERTAAPVQRREFPGAHDWDYWEQHIPGAIAFHAKALRISPVKPTEEPE
jgi:S-formylglutathione hydrolase FrmB